MITIKLLYIPMNVCLMVLIVCLCIVFAYVYVYLGTYRAHTVSKTCVFKLYSCSGHMEWCVGRSSVWGAHLTLELIIVTLLSML